MRKLLHIALMLIIPALLAGGKLVAQQDPMVTQYMFSGHYLNPGYVGHAQGWQMNLLHRSQWLKARGAPMTQVFSAEGPVGSSGLGMGFLMLNDHIGITNRASVAGDLAYHLGEAGGLRYALGLRLGMAWFRSDFTQLTYWDQNDQIYGQGIDNSILPDLGAGFFMHSNRFYAGVSVPHIISYDPSESFSIQAQGKPLPRIRRHYFVTSGVVIPVTQDFQIKPSFLIKYVAGAPVQADLNTSVFLKEFMEIGFSYRTGDGFLAMMMMRLGPKFRIGYAYDYSLTEMRMFSIGSHELFLGLDLSREKLKYRSPRYF